MPMPEKEFQDKFRQICANKTDSEKVVKALEGIERNTRFIVSVLALLAFLLVLSAYAFVLKADKIIELFN